MNLVADVVVTHRGVDARLTVPWGTTLALLGPNGSGKTTILESIAGLVPPDAGSVVFGDTVVFDAQAGVVLPPRKRKVALVTQSSELFPRMTAVDNVAFGPRAGGMDKFAAREQALDWLRRVHADEFADRRALELSGGQARRVAIARALASRPDVLLLDEPFAGLDLNVATQIRTMLGDLLPGVTTLLTTHNALDAHALADGVAILDAGQVVEQGVTEQVMSRPRTAFAARMAGRALLTGTATPHGLLLDTGELVPTDGTHFPGPAAVAIRPHTIEIAADGLRDTVRALEPHGDLVRVHCDRLMADVAPATAMRLRHGDLVHLTITGPPPAAYPLL